MCIKCVMYKYLQRRNIITIQQSKKRQIEIVDQKLGLLDGNPVTNLKKSRVSTSAQIIRLS